MVDGVESGRKIKEAKTRQLLWSNGIDKMIDSMASCYFIVLFACTRQLLARAPFNFMLLHDYYTTQNDYHAASSCWLRKRSMWFKTDTEWTAGQSRYWQRHAWWLTVLYVYWLIHSVLWTTAATAAALCCTQPIEHLIWIRSGRSLTTDLNTDGWLTDQQHWASYCRWRQR